MAVLRDIQVLVKDWLEADAYFAGIPIVDEQMGHVDKLITAAVGKAGACLVILTITARSTQRTAPGPFLDETSILIEAWEKVQLNKSGKSTLDLIERAASILHLHSLDDERQLRVLVSNDAIQRKNDPDYTGFDLELVTAAQLNAPALPTVATPGIADAAGTITLTCATAGAQTYYTIDGTQPGPANGTRYTVPFAPGDGVTVKARAGAWGYLPSATASHVT